MTGRERKLLGRVRDAIHGVPRAKVHGPATVTVGALSSWEKDSRHLLEMVSVVVTEWLFQDLDEAELNMDELEAWIEKRRLEGWEAR